MRADSSNLSIRRFNITEDKVNGPLNLKDTILSAQTSEPEWVRNGRGFVDVEEFDSTYVKCLVEQTGSADHFKITVRYVTSSPTAISQAELRRRLGRVFGLEDELLRFYEEFSSDKRLSLTFGPLRGLRLMRGTSLYESLICSILSQNNSAIRWNETARLLMKRYGKKVRFPDGSSWNLFPTPGDVAKLTVGELQRTTSMGYRARSVITVSRMIQDRTLDLEALVAGSYEDALESLLQLYGVGPKVADCFLLYGAGQSRAAPVDVWIHRIVNRLYLNGRSSRPATAAFLRDRYGEWAGYVQLYLFHYARTSKFGKTESPRRAHAS